MMIESYNIKVMPNKMPQKVASAFYDVTALVGAQYTPIAYLGSQQVNGINHAILSEQKVITGVDHTNIVVVVLNEKPQGITLVNIIPVIEQGGVLGGFTPDVQLNIPGEVMAAFELAAHGFVGSKIEPFAYLGSQMRRGAVYYLAAEVTPVVPNAESSVKIVTVDTSDNSLAFDGILD